MTAPPPPPPPGDMGAPTPRPARPRRTWVVVLVSVMLAILAVAGVGTVLFVSNTLPTYSAARDFISDVVDGKKQSAEDRLCSSASARPDAAILSIVQYFIVGGSITVNPFTVDRDGKRATVEYTIQPRDGGADRTYELPMREEGGDWKPCPAGYR